jgi:WD domain, G-beta repeat
LPDGALLTYGSWGFVRWPVHPDGTRSSNLCVGPPERLSNGRVTGAVCGSSSDGRTIAVPAYWNGAFVMRFGEHPRSFDLRDDQDIRSCAVSPDGRWIATGSHGNNDGYGAKVWDTATGRLAQRLPAPGLCQVVFAPTGRWLLTTGGGCRLWKTGSWEEGPSLGGTSGCFSPDGRLLAVELPGGAIRLVQSDSGAEVVRLRSPERGRLQPRCFNPDGTRLIATGQETQTLHVWDLRELRDGLERLGLDWEEAAYPAPALSMSGTPLSVTVAMGNLARMRDMDDLAFQAIRQIYDDKDFSGGIATLRRVVDECPEHLDSTAYLAWMLLVGPPSARDAQAALVTAQKAAALARSRHQYCEWPFDNCIGMSLYRLGRYTDALAALQSNVAEGGLEDAFNQFFSAMCYAQLGEAARATACYENGRRWFATEMHRLPARRIAQLKEIQAEAEHLIKGRAKRTN